MKNLKLGFFVFINFLFSSDLLLAARTIRIMSAGNTGIQLTNPSTVNVNYSAICYNSNGDVIENLVSQTLNTDKSITIGKGLAVTDFSPPSNGCTGGSTYVTCLSLSNGLPFIPCNGNFNYTNAESACASGLQLCEYTSGMYVNCGWSGYKYWLKPPTTGNALVFSSSPCTFTADHTLVGTEAVLLGDGCTSTHNTWRKCSQDGGTTVSERCFAGVKDTDTAGAFCCTRPSASFCKITINTTGANVFLASPQFKGGAAF